MIDLYERIPGGPGKKTLLPAFMILAVIALIAVAACSKHDTDFGSDSPLYTNDAYVAFDSAKPADTLRFGSLNMSIGFPVSQLLFTDMDDTAIAFVVLDSLFKRYQRTLPGARIKGMAKIIVDNDFDVVGMQEVMSFNKDGLKINDFLSELVDQIKAFGGPAYQVIDNPLNDTVLTGRLNGKTISISFHEGNALLVRPGLQILESANFMYFTLLPFATNAGTKSQRALQYAKLRSAKGIFWNVYNTHLEVFEDISSSQALELRRLVDSVKIQNSAKEDGAPQIVIGDFNVNPNEDAHTVMQEGGFKDTYDTTATDPGLTCCITASTLWDTNSNFSKRRIDFVFGRHMVKVTEHRVVMKDPIILASGAGLLLSDHRMVLTSIVGQ